MRHVASSKFQCPDIDLTLCGRGNPESPDVLGGLTTPQFGVGTPRLTARKRAGSGLPSLPPTPPTMPPTTQSLSDLVRDSEIEATVFQDYTTQVIYRAGRSARQRLVRIEERWVREGSLGHGAYGTVYKERCGDRVRAIKEIKKSVVAGEKIDYNRELEAIAKFSHPKVSFSMGGCTLVESVGRDGCR